MRNFKNLTLTVIALFSFAALVGCSDDDDNNPAASAVATSNVRVIHTSFDAPTVDIAVDGSVAIPGLAFGETSGFATLTSGTRNIKVTPENATSPVVINVNLPLEQGAEYTVLAIDSLSAIDAIVAVDDRTINVNKARVRFIHASPDAPAVDVKLNSGTGAKVFGNTAFKDVENYVEVDGGTYTFAVTAANTTSEVVVFNPVTVQNGMIYTIVAIGTLNAADSSPFTVRVFVDNGDGNAFLDLSPTI